VEVGKPLTVGDVEWTVTSARPAGTLTSSVDGGNEARELRRRGLPAQEQRHRGLELELEISSPFDGSGRKFEFDTDAYLYIDPAKNLFRVEVSPGTSQEGDHLRGSPIPRSFSFNSRRRRTFSDESGYVHLGL
jgi:hypothetical protein